MNQLGFIAFHQRRYDAAGALHEESLAIRRELGDRSGIAESFYALGLIAHRLGDSQSAHSLLIDGLQIQRETGNRVGITNSLEALAKLAGEAQGHPADSEVGRRAARLFGAAEALREAIGAPLPPNEREDYQRHVARARDRWAKKAFDIAWAEGRKMSLEQAVEYALDQRTPESDGPSTIPDSAVTAC